MIVKMLTRTVVADKRVANLCQIVCSIVSGLVMLFGIRRLAQLDLIESQLYAGLTSTLLLAGVFIILGFQCRAWKRAAQHEALAPNRGPRFAFSDSREFAYHICGFTFLPAAAGEARRSIPEPTAYWRTNYP